MGCFLDNPRFLLYAVSEDSSECGCSTYYGVPSIEELFVDVKGNAEHI